MAAKWKFRRNNARRDQLALCMESILNWVAPIATIVAALMTASNLGAKITGAGFIVFTVGSIAG